MSPWSKAQPRDRVHYNLKNKSSHSGFIDCIRSIFFFSEQVFHGFFTFYSMPHIRMLLKISQFIYAIFFSKAIIDLLFMLHYSIFQITRNTYI